MEEMLAKPNEILDRHDDKWQKDDERSICPCGQKFTLLKRRHHCRVCGFVFCEVCTEYVAIYGIGDPELACAPCITELRKRRKAEEAEKFKKRESIKAALNARAEGKERKIKTERAEDVTKYQMRQQIAMRAQVSAVLSEEASNPPLEEKKEIPLISTPSDWKQRHYAIFPLDASSPEWVKDDTVESCQACKIEFTKKIEIKKILETTRRHHCRSCGGIFCDECTPLCAHDVLQKEATSLRICETCAVLILSKNFAEAKAVADERAKLEKIADAKRAEWHAEREAKEKALEQQAKLNWTDKENDGGEGGKAAAKPKAWMDL